MSRSSPRVRLTAEQRLTLAKTHVNHGFRAGRALCAELGVNPHHAAKLARKLGFTNGATKPRAAKVNGTDPRWAWAVERGAVVA